MKDVGAFCLVLHTHLPWLAHHGSWPVGEEWLHQSWADSYQRVLAVVRGLADQGGRDLLTLGVTPVVTAQLDDEYCLAQQRTWLADWYWRAVGMTAARDRATRAAGRREGAAAHRATADFEEHWSAGGSPVLRRVADAGAVELLGGPLTHPFQPLLDPQVASLSLRAGLDDAAIRVGKRPTGLWAPECGYRPGLAELYREHGVSHFVVDGPTLRHVGADTALAHPIDGVLAFGRDLDVTYRVWSPRKGYPGGRWYRDFHSYDHEWGVRRNRVTSPTTSAHEKAPYDPERARAAVERDARDFVAVVHTRLQDIRNRTGRPGLTVAAYDTELFGHWWHEGPEWLERVLTLLPEAGVTVTTLRGAAELGLVGEPVQPEAGSWGAGKDWNVWAGETVHDLVADNTAAQARVLELVKALEPGAGRTPSADQLVRNMLLALSSDWAFMVSHDSAAEYARSRHQQHHWAVAELAALVEERGWSDPATIALATTHRAVDGPFGHVDARLLG